VNDKGRSHQQRVSGDLLETAWLALVDGFRLPLMRLAESGRPMPAADSSWAV
jgi:hypothetical protein